MDVDNAEEQKDLSICMQEQYTGEHFYNYSHNDQNIIILLKYKKISKFCDLKEKPDPSLIITRYSENFLKTTEKAKADIQERLRMNMSIYSQLS